MPVVPGKWLCCGLECCTLQCARPRVSVPTSDEGGAGGKRPLASWRPLTHVLPAALRSRDRFRKRAPARTAAMGSKGEGGHDRRRQTRDVAHQAALVRRGSIDALVRAALQAAPENSPSFKEMNRWPHDMRSKRHAASPMRRPPQQATCRKPHAQATPARELRQRHTYKEARRALTARQRSAARSEHLPRQASCRKRHRGSPSSPPWVGPRYRPARRRLA